MLNLHAWRFSNLTKRKEDYQKRHPNKSWPRKLPTHGNYAGYAGKWKNLENWCLSNDLQPLNATIPQITDFLLYLFYERKLSFKSMKGYRTAF